MSASRLLTVSAVLLGFAFVIPACVSQTGDDQTGDEQDVKGGTPKPCAGIAGIKCAGSLTCVDDPSDSCDPKAGGRDCGGLCVNPKTATHCGGLAGLKCAKGLTCVEDPTSPCATGGAADCSGICINAPVSTDCRSVGCSDKTHQCVPCWGSFSCIPKGAVC